MTKAKKSVFAFVAVLAVAFIIGATMDGPDYGMNNAQASESSPVEMMKLAADHEDGGHCC